MCKDSLSGYFSKVCAVLFEEADGEVVRVQVYAEITHDDLLLKVKE